MRIHPFGVDASSRAVGANGACLLSPPALRPAGLKEELGSAIAVF